MSPNKLLIASAVATLLSAIPARADLVRAVTFDEKVSNAEAIVLGHCTATRSEWDPNHRWILTYATFDVDESVKGAPAKQITVVTPGGTVGSIHQSSSGITPFEKGDQRLLFVKNTRLGPTVLYFDQGTYDVAKDGHGERVITPIASNVVRMDSQAGTVVPVEQPRTLRDFIGAVRESERRIDAVRMEMVERQGQKQLAESPMRSILARYWFLVAIALAGAALTTWQILKK